MSYPEGYSPVVEDHEHIMVDDFAVAQMSDLTLSIGHCMVVGCGIISLQPDRPIKEHHLAPMLELASTLLNVYKQQQAVIKKTGEMKGD